MILSRHDRMTLVLTKREQYREDLASLEETAKLVRRRIRERKDMITECDRAVERIAIENDYPHPRDQVKETR